MKNLSVVCTVPAAPPSPTARVLSFSWGAHALQHGLVVLARWWQTCSWHGRSARMALAPRVRPLDVEALGAHLQRDLNLHDNVDGWLQAQKAWRQYEHYRDAQDWRRPF